MARDNRIIDENGQRINFTCENRRFRTNIRKGESHGILSPTMGAVFDQSLINHTRYTLWLEHVIDKTNGDEYYWLMWYDNGRPTIPLSGVFDRNDLEEMVGRLARLVP